MAKEEVARRCQDLRGRAGSLEGVLDLLFGIPGESRSEAQADEAGCLARRPKIAKEEALIGSLSVEGVATRVAGVASSSVACRGSASVGSGGAYPSSAGADPKTVGADPRTVRADVKTVGGDPKTLGGDPKTLGAGPRTVGADPRTVGRGPKDPNIDLDSRVGSRQVLPHNVPLSKDANEAITTRARL